VVCFQAILCWKPLSHLVVHHLYVVSDPVTRGVSPYFGLKLHQVSLRIRRASASFTASRILV